MQAIKRGTLSPEDVLEATSRVRSIPTYMEKTAQGLPSTSAVHIYASLSRFLACQLDRLLSAVNEQELSNMEQDLLFEDWWRTVNYGSLDPAAWVDIDFLGPEQTNLDTTELGPNLIDFVFN